MTSPALCEEAERFLVNHPEKKLTVEQRKQLACYTPDTQVKWLTNPFVQMMIEAYLADLRQAALEQAANPHNQTQVTAPVNKPTPVSDNKKPKPDDEEPEEPTFSLFD